MPFKGAGLQNAWGMGSIGRPCHRRKLPPYSAGIEQYQQKNAWYFAIHIKAPGGSLPTSKKASLTQNAENRLQCSRIPFPGEAQTGEFKQKHLVTV